MAIWLAEEPLQMLPILNGVASEIVQEIYPDYNDFHKYIFVRLKDLPVEDKLRELRQVHLNALIRFRGVVTKRTQVFPQYQEMFFRCKCGDIKGLIESYIDKSYHLLTRFTGTNLRCRPRRGQEESQRLYCLPVSRPLHHR